ncbi:zinc finger, CCHC-type containing protein [Tanacetum coccineum]
MGAIAMKHMDSYFSKLDKFERVDFRRWQKKMHFLLSSMSVVYVLTTPILKDSGDDATVEQIRKRAKRDNDDYVCRELWDSLEAKYMAKDASSKKFLVSNFTNYKITDSRPVIEQRNELLGILRRFTQHILQVSCIIDKLPPSWKDFKHTLKHKKEELTLVELGSHLRIEESLRAQDSDKPKGNNVAGPHYLCDLNVIPSLGNKKYFVTFIDDASRTDRGGEYMDTMYFQSVGIIHEMTAPILHKKMVYLKGKIRAVVRLPNPKLKNLGERGTECIFVGYAEHSKVFRLYVIKPNDSVSINSIIESKDAIFDENRFSSVPRPSQRSLVNKTEDIGCSVVPEEVTEEVVQQPEPELRKSKRNRTPKDFGPEFQLYLIEGTRDKEVAFRKEAINDEMDSIIGNNTWLLADLPLGCKRLGCKWIFKRKLKVDGTIKIFKARLVIQGFKQKSMIDYFDTFALVARINTIRMLIAMVSIHNLVIHQMDVKTTFLNSKLDKVYMNQPQGFIMPGNENKVDLTKEFLSSRFFMKDMGEADVILGIRIKHESKGITIFQSHYIEKVLKKFNYFDCTPVSTLMDTSKKLMPNNGQAVSQLEYSRVISCLMYTMTCTRPDVAFAVGKLSRYTSNPVLEGYTNASWISNTKDNSSTSGWVFLLATGKEAECQMYNGKSRYLGVSHSMIHEMIRNGVISIEFVRSQQNLADHLAKELARDLVIKSAERMRLNGLKHMYLHIILRMCLEPAKKEDEVVNFLMVNFFEKVLSRSMNKEEPPMYSNGLKGSILITP